MTKLYGGAGGAGGMPGGMPGGFPGGFPGGAGGPQPGAGGSAGPTIEVRSLTNFIFAFTYLSFFSIF